MVESSSFHTTSCSAKRCADFKSLGSQFKVPRTKIELKVKKGFFCRCYKVPGVWPRVRSDDGRGDGRGVLLCTFVDGATVSFLRDFVSLSCFFFLSLSFSFSFLFFKFKLLYELRLVPKVCIHVFSKSSAVIISV